MANYRRYAAMLVVSAAVFAGCTTAADESSTPRIIQPGAPGEPSRELTPEELAAIEMPQHNEADVRFMQSMIAHHEQALRITAMVADHTERDDLPLFAERMDISQADEIELMQAWLEARDEEASGGHGHTTDDDGEPRYGMLTEDEFNALEAASGPDFDRLFLELMTRHHQGAIQMVQELYDEGGGAEPEINQFAAHVEADQNIELGRMATMLEELDAGTSD